MEKLFEEFVCGFIKKHLPEVLVKAQSTSVYLDEKEVFNLQPDLVISADAHKMIVDTKYKIIYSDSTDPKKGVSQNDLYQMVAYAIRFNCTSIILFYPSTINNELSNNERFTISDELANGEIVTVSLYQLPIINYDLLTHGNELLQKVSFERLFDKCTESLKNVLQNIFKSS